MVKYIAVVFGALLFSYPLHSQKPDSREVKSMANKVAEMIKSNYVLADKGNAIAAYFLKDFRKGRFSGAQNWKELDSITTKSLREASNGDGHLFTWNNLELVEQLRQEVKNSSDEENNKETVSFFNNKEAFASNFGFQKVEILQGNIGYIKLSSINISGISLETLFAAMEFVKNTDALVIDIQDNGGGGSTLGSVLETFFFDKETTLLEFTSRTGQTEIKKTVPWLLEDRYKKPLSILINQKTGSAAEAFAFALKHQDRATVIGEPSAGAAYMNTYFPINDHLVLAISTSAPFLPGTQQSWERKGVQPDIVVSSETALEKALASIKATLNQQ